MQAIKDIRPSFSLRESDFFLLVSLMMTVMFHCVA